MMKKYVGKIRLSRKERKLRDQWLDGEEERQRKKAERWLKKHGPHQEELKAEREARLKELQRIRDARSFMDDLQYITKETP